MFSKEIIEQIKLAKAMREAKAEEAKAEEIKAEETEIDESYDAIRMAGSEYTDAPPRDMFKASW